MVLAFSEEIAEASRSMITEVLDSTMEDTLVAAILAMAADQGVDIGNVSSIAVVQSIAVQVDHAWTTVTTTTLTNTTTMTLTSTTITTTATTPGLTGAVPLTSTASSAVFASVLVVLATLLSLVVCCWCCYKPKFGSVKYTGWDGNKEWADYQVEKSTKDDDQRTHIVWRLDHRRAGRALGNLQRQADDASRDKVGSVMATPAAGVDDVDAAPPTSGGDVLLTATSDALEPAGLDIAEEEALAEWPSAEEEVSPIMEPQTIVEYYSRTNTAWTTGRLKVFASGRSRGQDPVVRYDVVLSGARTQVRRDVPLWRLRPALEEGELVEVFSRLKMQWARAVVAHRPQIAGAQGNSVPVRMEEDGSVKTVLTSRVRRLFPDGMVVKVYTGAVSGWIHGVIDYAAAGGEPPPIEMEFGDAITGGVLSAASNVTRMSGASFAASKVTPGGSRGSLAEDFSGVVCPWCMVPFREFGDEDSVGSIWVPSYVVVFEGAFSLECCRVWV